MYSPFLFLNVVNLWLRPRTLRNPRVVCRSQGKRLATATQSTHDQVMATSEKMRETREMSLEEELKKLDHSKASLNA